MAEGEGRGGGSYNITLHIRAAISYQGLDLGKLLFEDLYTPYGVWYGACPVKARTCHYTWESSSSMVLERRRRRKNKNKAYGFARGFRIIMAGLVLRAYSAFSALLTPYVLRCTM